MRSMGSVRGRSPEDVAAFWYAWHRQKCALNPTPEQRYLQILAWAATNLRVLEARGAVFASEERQYVALYQARKMEISRGPKSCYCETLRDVSRGIWAARADVRRAMERTAQ